KQHDYELSCHFTPGCRSRGQPACRLFDADLVLGTGLNSAIGASNGRYRPETPGRLARPAARTSRAASAAPARPVRAIPSGGTIGRIGLPIEGFAVTRPKEH